MNIKKLISVILTIVSIAASLMLIVYGVRGAFSENIPTWIIVFNIFTIGYGVGSLAILVWAWCNGGNKSIKYIKYMAIGFLALFIIGSMDVGMISGLEFVLILFVALLLCVNWYSVKYVARWRENA